jgi:hypothetical protein
MRIFDMFTHIMNGVINEITRGPANAPRAPAMPGSGRRGRPVPQVPVSTKQIPAARRSGTQLPGKYRVLAESFRRAAGFN